MITHGVDNHAVLIRSELEHIGADVVWFDTDQFRRTSDLAFGIKKGVPRVLLRIGDTEHDAETFGSVLFRHIRLPVAPHILDPEARRMAESELRSTLEGGLLAIDAALWMNHPHANRVASNKLLQLKLAAQMGFKVPETIVTADPHKIRTLYGLWNRRMVAKLVGGQLPAKAVDSQYVVYTTPMREEDLQDTEALSACPAIYQRHLPKRYDLRVTVVGDDVFPCRIHSQNLQISQVDWRVAGHAALLHQACELDVGTADRCRALLRTLGLQIAGIDLLVTPEGETVFLEINAAGQWAWVQESTGLPIAAAIARRLTAGLCEAGTVTRSAS